MRRARPSVWCRILALWVSALLLVSVVQMVPAQAKDSLLSTSAQAIAETEGSTEGSTENDAEASQPGVSAFTDGSIAKELVDADGHSYSVIVTYGEEAQIPEGAELHVGMPEDSDDAMVEKRASRVERVLALGQGDRVLNTTYLDVSIEANGQVVRPASAVHVSIRTDDIKPAQSSYVEVVVLGEDQDLVDGEFVEACADDRIESKNLTVDEEGTRDTELAFSADRLGTVAFASVATRQELWNGKGLAMSLLVPRHGPSISIVDAAAPELEEGVDPLFCRAIKADPSPAYGTTLWLEAQPSEDEALQEDEGLAGVLAYLLDDVESVPGEPLCGSAGLQEPVELSAEEELLLVWDSGYRNARLDLADVRVEGMMPEGTQGSALDVTQAYAEPVTLMEGLDEDSAGAFEAGALEVTTLAAYDINLQTDGEEYQPDDEHPLAVTITTDALEGALSSGKDVQVWHIADEGTVEVIKDFRLSDGAITFEATGFSTYLLVARGEKSESEVPLSSRFGIRATAKTYERATTVTFVDVDKNPIKGTVTGTLNIAYTGNGPESNATNTIDLYEFIDKLDPAIADEYDFSRVFVQLTETDQKDFRFIQVGDDTAIGGTDTSKYRAYLYMDSIAQNASGQDYDGTWYLLSNGGNIDNVYIEYYHVFPASFYALDTRNDPVAGAKFALYTDPECSIPFEYQHKEITATSDMNGLVSFGKVPQGTYYMKETVFPEGYKKSTNTYTVEVDGETTIDNVVHDDDDGGIIITGVSMMVLHKQWVDGVDKHVNDSVEINVYAHGTAICDSITLNTDNDWTYALAGLDPNELYMVSETCVMSGDTDVTTEWIPTISYEERDPHAGYGNNANNVRSADVTISNKTTRYPIQIRNVTYPDGAPLSDTTFDLYKEDGYSATNPGTPYMVSLTAGDDGYLRNGSDTQLELGAGTYYLLQTKYAERYAPLSKAVKFTITRDGALKVAQEDQEVAGFAYSTTVGEGTAALPVLQIPNMIPATVEVTMNVEGECADLACEFEFTLTMCEGMDQLTGTIGDDTVVFKEEASSFKLTNGETLRLEDVPATVDYVLTQTKVPSYEVLAETDTDDAVTVSATDGDAFVVTLSNLNGTSSEPARVTITNVFSKSGAPATGIDDNAAVWGAIVAACGVLISLLLFRHRARL